ncbi:ligase-associated DNA damage response endonuclease PdeM [Rhodobacteraceae bacterium NNCM2]|nr:ligase-associated DNA damage response endonuclease PdeM [Coraliihabitans acroporae]
MLGENRVEAQPSGALWWPERSLLVVADLHLGRAERMAREGGALLPPYETAETLDRLDAEVNRLQPRLIISLGDSFDDLTAARNLGEEVVLRLERLSAGRRLIWIAGNHDPGPVNLPGTHLDQALIAGVHLRHIADPTKPGAEISGHYHPKALVSVKGRRISRRCFLVSDERVVLPAFGTYTGGLDILDPAFGELTGGDCRALLTGNKIISLPVEHLRSMGRG